MIVCYYYNTLRLLTWSQYRWSNPEEYGWINHRNPMGTHGINHSQAMHNETVGVSCGIYYIHLWYNEKFYSSILFPVKYNSEIWEVSINRITPSPSSKRKTKKLYLLKAYSYGHCNTFIWVVRSFLHFAQSMAVILPCSVQNVEMIWHLTNKLWLKEVWI